MSKLLVVFQTHCPTCRLIIPYLNALANAGVSVAGVSQDGDEATREFVRNAEIQFHVWHDRDFEVSKRLGVVTVPAVYVFDAQDRIIRRETGFDKTALNGLASLFGIGPIATPLDGAPDQQRGRASRHLRADTAE